MVENLLRNVWIGDYMYMCALRYVRGNAIWRTPPSTSLEQVSPKFGRQLIERQVVICAYLKLYFTSVGNMYVCA